jgi:hypothetical protein
MKTYKFENYDPANGHPPLEDILWDLPIELLDYKTSIIRQAGFDPADNPRIGGIKAWGKHKAQSIIVAPDINFIPGSRFAISTEPA